MHPGYRLPAPHLAYAKQMVLKHKKKTKCNYCYDRGFIGYSEENLLIICHRCVDQDAVLADWKKYVQSVPELWAEFKEDIEKEEAEKKAEEQKAAEKKAAERKFAEKKLPA